MARTWVLRVATLSVLVPACARQVPPGLETVEPPPDLEQLDESVRTQFDEVSGVLRGGSASPADWGELARWYDVYGYAEIAARCYRNARRTDPREPRWPYHLGVLAEKRGDFASAVAAFEAAVALAPHESGVRIRLGDLALQQGQLDRAERFYAEVLASEPASAGALLGAGRVALLRGDPRRAVEALEAVLRQKPEAVPARYTLALAWRRLGDEGRARELLAKVPQQNLDQVSIGALSEWDIELEARDRGARGLTQRGLHLYRRGEYERAADLLGRAVAADPDGPEKRINYASVLRRLGRSDGAARELQEAIRLAQPGSGLAATAHVEMGRLLLSEGRPRPAAVHFESALRIDPASAAARLELGRVRHGQGRLEEALAEYGSVRAQPAVNPAACFWYATLLVQLDRHDEAVAAVEADLRRAGDDRPLSLLLARLLAASPERALRDPSRARRLIADAAAPADVLYAESRAMVEAGDGRFQSAAAWQRAAVRALAAVGSRSAHIARRRLVLYDRGEPCRTPWEREETPLLVAVTPPEPRT